MDTVALPANVSLRLPLAKPGPGQERPVGQWESSRSIVRRGQPLFGIHQPTTRLRLPCRPHLQVEVHLV
jgi:hypothetical protein